MKLKSFCTAEEAINKMKRPPTEWEKICANEGNDKLLISKIGEELQDEGRVRHGDHLPPHKYIRNTSTRGTAPIEHLLNAGRRP